MRIAWNSPEKVTQAYRELKQELGRVPTYGEFEKKYSGALSAVERGKIIPNVTTWNGFLRYLGDGVGHDIGRWNTPEKIARAYDQLKQELGRVPTNKDFVKKYNGALNAIRRGKVIPKVRTWNGFLKYMGDMASHYMGIWNTPEKIIRAYENCKKELGRCPTSVEFRERNGGALNAVIHNKIIPKVRTWNGFFRYIGEDVNHDSERWNNPEKIVQAYAAEKRELGRAPTYEEFEKKYGGALNAISKGKVPDVTTWNEFLRYMGEKLNKDGKRWDTPEKIAQAYDQLKQELGRVPTSEEFGKKYTGIRGAITQRMIIPNVRTWNGFVRYMGDELTRDTHKWDCEEKVTRAYNDLKQELGKVPTQIEFTKKHGGALNAIMHRKVIPNVTTWVGFIRYMGDKPCYQTKDPISLLESLLEEDNEQTGDNKNG